MISETSKWRHVTAPYCVGNGIDIGSGGDPVVPWAIQVDLPETEFDRYNNGQKAIIHWRGDCRKLPFGEATLDFVYSSHLIEDFDANGQRELLRYWAWMLKSGGHLVILAPEATRWTAAVAAGQPPNCAHRHELAVGEIRAMVPELFVVRDEIPGDDYSLLFVGRKP